MNEDLKVSIGIILLVASILCIAFVIGYVAKRDMFFGLLVETLLVLASLPVVGIYSIWKSY